MRNLKLLVAFFCVTLMLNVPVMATTRGVIQSYSTFVPVRGAFSELGFNIKWDEDTKRAYIKDNRFSLEIPVGQIYIYVNGKMRRMKQPQRIINGSLYLPLREISEIIDASIYWDEESKAAILYYDKYMSAVSCDQNSFMGDMSNYAEFINVPDFGCVKGYTLVSKSRISGGYSYKYTLDNRVSQNERYTRLEAYYALLQFYGFAPDEASKTFYCARLNQRVVQKVEGNNITLTVTQE